MTTTTALNGINVEALKETVSAVAERRALGEVTFAISGIWDGGCRLVSQTGPLTQAGEADEQRIGKFKMSSDEPEALLGTDTGVSPAEYLLKALAACYTVTLTANAAARGIELQRYDLELTADFDLAGFLGVDDTVGTGAQSIQVNIHLDAPDASRAELEELLRVVESRSPIRGTLTQGVEVHSTLA